MRLTHMFLSIILLIGIFLINGCTNQAEQVASLKNCPDYDGTWKGVIADSGSLVVVRYDAEGNAIKTNNPFTAQYDFEMTLECEAGDGNHWNYKITKAKASHPIFGCTDGCVPVQPFEGGGAESWLELDTDTGSSMMVEFPNGALIMAFVGPGSVEFSDDGEKLMLYIQRQTGITGIIGINGVETDDYQDIETDNCKRLGGEGDCYIDYINKNTIILNKIN